MTPLLVLLYGITPAVAIGTDLLYAAITRAAGAVVHGLKNAVDWRVVGWRARGSVPTSAMTLTCLSAYQPATKDADWILKLAPAVMLLATALALLYRKPLQAWAAVGATVSHLVTTTARPLATAAVGAAIGAAV